MADEAASGQSGNLDPTALNEIASNGQFANQAIGEVTKAIAGLAAITLPVPKGGTGRDTLTQHAVLIGNGTDPVNFASPVANVGAAFISQGASSDPVFGRLVLTQPATLATLTISDGKTLTATRSGTLGGGDGYTLAIAANKTLTVSNSLTLVGTDSTTMTFPASNANVAALNIADQTLTGGANVTSKSLTTGSVTIDCGACPLQYITNGGAFTITAPSNDGSCIVLVTNNASAGAISFSGFSVSSNTGDALTTTNGNKFMITVVRINATATYLVKALQ